MATTAPKLAFQPQMIGTKAAADLLGVVQRTVLNWIDRGLIPYVELPSGQYRIPLAGLQSSLGGTYDVVAELAVFDERNAAAGAREEEIVAQVLESEPQAYVGPRDEDDKVERSQAAT